MQDGVRNRISGIELVVASHNTAKVHEIRQVLGPAGVRVLSLCEVGFCEEIEEKGPTFEENAATKALVVAQGVNKLSLADDSGLAVEALGGRPGIQSARYGGPGLSDADRVALLLSELRTVPYGLRTAEFVCVLALAAPCGRVVTWAGRVYGLIADGPRGTGGFGYDPVFVHVPSGKTFAEMSLEEKNAVSHRGRAIRRLPLYLTRTV
jgi:XTP/dITP diphosphohydrolase